MKVVILGGGLGTRLAEETEIKPKPMVEIGDQPILWHIMKHYAHYGFNEFYIALGYKGAVVKRYFLDYHGFNRNVTINLADGKPQFRDSEPEDWTVHLIDTGSDTMTGGRIKRLEEHLKDETFMVTYGDGVSNIDINELVKFHRSQGKLATITAVRPPARFGELIINKDHTAGFSEKPQTHEGWINGGFMVLEPKIFDYLKGDKSVLEIDLLERLANERQLTAYRHDGFWQCMDTLRDKRQLEAAWQSGTAGWKVW